MEKDKKEKSKWIQKVQVHWLIPFFIMGLEVLFHMEIYGHFDFNMVHAILFSLSFSFFILLIGSTRWRHWNVILRCLFLLCTVIYFIAQIMYHQVFGNFLTVKSIVNGAGQVMDFGTTIWEAFREHMPVIGVAVISFAGYAAAEMIAYHKEAKSLTQTGNMQDNKSNLNKNIVICIAVIVVTPFLGTLLLMAEDTGIGSAYDVKMNFYRTEQSMYRLGLSETLIKDVREKFCDMAGITQNQFNSCYLWIEKQFFDEDFDKTAEVYQELTGQKKKTSVKEDGKTSSSQKKEPSYHKWDINFDMLKENTTDEELQQMHSYFSQIEATAENKYTGLFKDYNLIYITAESFSDVVIDKERTPILYRMQQEGFQFQNFYTPSWYLSTIDGEYVNCLGQIPVDGDWSLEHASENTLSLALGNQLKEKGYVCNAYHNHDSYYYDRTKTHPKLGYEFKAVGAGLTFTSKYPESDLELMEITAREYIDREPFHTYYVTMSGHLPYTYAYNSMAVKNRDIVEAEELSENAACYLAANEELEYAVEYLVEELEQKNQLERTLFVIVSDHYPYGLKNGAYDELKGEAVEGDVFERYQNTCLIWSASMVKQEESAFPVKVEKYSSNLDLLPTISNLMGLSYDSRLLAGRDVLSEDAGLVLFKDHSFLTARVRYNATTGEAVWAEGETEDAAYLERCMQTVQDRFYYSAQILNKDYMKVIESK